MQHLKGLWIRSGSDKVENCWRLSLVHCIEGNFYRALSPHLHRSSAIGYGGNLFRKMRRRSLVRRLDLSFAGAKSSARVTPMPRIGLRQRHRPAIRVDSPRIDPRLGNRDGKKRYSLSKMLCLPPCAKINNGLLVNHVPIGAANDTPRQRVKG